MLIKSYGKRWTLISKSLNIVIKLYNTSECRSSDNQTRHVGMFGLKSCFFLGAHSLRLLVPRGHLILRYQHLLSSSTSTFSATSSSTSNAINFFVYSTLDASRERNGMQMLVRWPEVAWSLKLPEVAWSLKSRKVFEMRLKRVCDVRIQYYHPDIIYPRISMILLNTKAHVV